MSDVILGICIGVLLAATLHRLYIACERMDAMRAGRHLAVRRRAERDRQQQHWQQACLRAARQYAIEASRRRRQSLLETIETDEVGT